MILTLTLKQPGKKPKVALTKLIRPLGQAYLKRLYLVEHTFNHLMEFSQSDLRLTVALEEDV